MAGRISCIFLLAFIGRSFFQHFFLYKKLDNTADRFRVKIFLLNLHFCLCQLYEIRIRYISLRPFGCVLGLLSSPCQQPWSYITYMRKIADILENTCMSALKKLASDSDSRQQQTAVNRQHMEKSDFFVTQNAR